MNQKKRSDIPLESTWDLEPLYSSTEKWEKDFNKLEILLGEVSALHGTLGESVSNLKLAYERLDALYRTLEKVYVYAHLKSDEDISNSENSGLLNRISAKFAEIQGATAWFEPEVLSLSDEKIQEYIKSQEMAFYRRSLEELLRDKPHMLSAAEEKIMGLASDALSTPQQTFSALSNADMKFPEIKNDKGESITLTHGNYTTFLESENREVRKNAFNAMYDTFSKYSNTFATTLAGCIKSNVLNAGIRKFPSALEASLNADKVPKSVYDNLISAVNSKLDYFYEYLELRREILGIEQIDMYDLHSPIVKGCTEKYKWEDACSMVVDAVEPLGGEYVDEVKRGFAGRWVDVYESAGKRSGAYSSGCYDSYPYILMNYQGNMNDVFTLAHELGHSMHSLLSKSAQEYHYADYKIFVAEVASTTNELLLHHSLTQKSDDRNFKLYLLSHLADGIRGTVYRQTMFAEFEKMIYENFESGIPLTPDSLTESYYDINKRYHGPKVNPDDKIGFEWMRIPHFYYNFYVYKYATGFSAAAALSKGIISGDSSKIDAYLNFLKAGSTKDVLDIMKDAGVDLTTPQPVEDAMQLFAETVEQLKVCR
jgi:oligoendopeptidase F